MEDPLGWFEADTKCETLDARYPQTTDQTVWSNMASSSFFDPDSINARLGLTIPDIGGTFNAQLRATTQPGVSYYPQRLDDVLYLIREERREGLVSTLQTLRLISGPNVLELPSMKDVVTGRMSNFYGALNDMLGPATELLDMMTDVVEPKE